MRRAARRLSLSGAGGDGEDDGEAPDAPQDEFAKDSTSLTVRKPATTAPEGPAPVAECARDVARVGHAPRECLKAALRLQRASRRQCLSGMVRLASPRAQVDETNYEVLFKEKARLYLPQRSEKGSVAGW
jgi:hypothetical protein